MGWFVFLQQVTELRNSEILTAVLLKTQVFCHVTLCLWGKQLSAFSRIVMSTYSGSSNVWNYWSNRSSYARIYESSKHELWQKMYIPQQKLTIWDLVFNKTFCSFMPFLLRNNWRPENDSILTPYTTRVENLIFMDPCIVDDSVEKPTRCSFIIEFIIPQFIEGSTCFERHIAHHQEL